MYERDIDPCEELTDDFCNFLEAHPWHGSRESNNLDYEYRANGSVHVPDEPEVQDGPHCPIEVLDALEICGRVSYQAAIGEPVSPELAAEAAGRAVKCFTCYAYEQQPWFTEALPFMKKREPRNAPPDERLNQPHANSESNDKCETKATT